MTTIWLYIRAALHKLPMDTIGEAMQSLEPMAIAKLDDLLRKRGDV